MTNAQIIANLSAALIATINFRLTMGYSLDEAKRHARERSIAGPAVWVIVEEHFA